MIREKRNLTRFRCRFRVRVTVREQNYEGYALDISEEGMRISTDKVIDIWTGDKVDIVSDEIGLITGSTAWRNPGEFGVLFDESTNTIAKIQNIRKYFSYPIM